MLAEERAQILKDSRITAAEFREMDVSCLEHMLICRLPHVKAVFKDVILRHGIDQVGYIPCLLYTSEPEYSGGIFSETGDITITGKDTVVEAGGGYAEKGSTAIGAEAGNLIIKDGKVRADGAYPVTSDTGFANGFSSCLLYTSRCV